MTNHQNWVPDDEPPTAASIPLFDDDDSGTHRSPLAAGGAWARLAAPRPPTQPAPIDETTSAPAEPELDGDAAGPIDWALVAKLRLSVAHQLSERLVDREGMDEDTRREIGRSIINTVVAEQSARADRAGTSSSYADQQLLRKAIYDSVFGLGRLQPLVDDPNIENIECYGYNTVFLIYADGSIRRGAPVADSDEQLIADLQFMASRAEAGERPFSPAHPNLDMKLPGNHRLSANAWISPQPYVVIRRHRLVKISMDEMVTRKMLTPAQASFLQACIKAKMSIVVSGPQGGGKTTMVRALALSLSPWEAIATIETEYELLLHEMDDRERIMAFEARPGSGEKDGNGRRAGEVTLDDLTYWGFRKNRSRTILGEVRGEEILTLLDVMQAGNGSLSTVHAGHARGAIHRLVGLATKAGGHLATYASSQIAAHIDIVVQIGLDDHIDPVEDPETGEIIGTRSRYVSEILLVEPGEAGGFAFTDIYKRGRDGRARPHTLPADLRDHLHRYGFTDPELPEIAAEP